MIQYRIELWTRTGAERLAVLGRAADVVRSLRVRGEERLSLRVADRDPALEHLSTGAVLRVQEEGSAGVSLWRLSSSTRSRDEQGRVGTAVTADALWMDLRQGRVRQRQAGGVTFTVGLVGLTPREWIERVVLPGYDGATVAFEAGDVELSDPVDLSLENVSPLAALRLLEEETEGELEFELVPGQSLYRVHLRERVGSRDAGAELRYGKNLQGLERVVEEEHVATRLYARGSGMLTLADARWPVASVAGSVVSLVPSPVFEDGAFTADPVNGIAGKFFYVPGKGGSRVLASHAASGTLTLESAAALAPGDEGWLAHDAEGTLPLEYLESPAGVAAYGVRVDDLSRDDVPDAANRVANPFLARWSGGLPEAWEKAGLATVLQSTHPLHARWGGTTAHLQCVADGDGLQTLPFTLEDDPRRPYTGLRVGLTVLAGRVRVELAAADGTLYPVEQRPVSEGLNVYSELTAGPVHDEPLPAGSYRLRVLAHGGPAELHLDFAMATPVLAGDVPAVVEGRGAWELWGAAAAELAVRRLPRREYRVRALDLHRADPRRFVFDRLELGDSVRVADPEFGVEELRIVELEQDLRRVEEVSVAVAPSPAQRASDSLTPFLPRPRPRRPGAGLGLRNPARPWIVSHVPAVTAGQVVVRFMANESTSSVALFTKATHAAPWPAAPAQTLAGWTGEFAAVAMAQDGLFYRLVPRDRDGVDGLSAEGSVARAAVPVIEVADRETAARATLWWRIQERGIAVSEVKVSTQVGRDPASAFAAPQRKPGDPSTVRTGSLGPGEYEQDVELVADRLSWITPRLTLATGEVMVPGPYPFDRNAVPNIVTLDVQGTTVKCVGDNEVRSWWLRRVVPSTPPEGDPGAWQQFRDGSQTTFTGVPVPDAATWEMEILAFGEPASVVQAAVTNGTITTWNDSDYDLEKRLVRGANVTTTDRPSWTSVDAYAPDEMSTVMSVSLVATGDLAGYALRVWSRSRPGGGTWSPWVNRTDYLTPAVASPPAAQELYEFDVPTSHAHHESGYTLVTYEVRAELVDAAGTVQDARAALAGWYVYDRTRFIDDQDSGGTSRTELQYMT